MKYNFPVIIIDEDYHSETASGLGIRDVAKAIETHDISVVAVTSFSDLTSFARQQARAGAFIISMDDEDFADEAAVRERRRGRLRQRQGARQVLGDRVRDRGEVRTRRADG